MPYTEEQITDIDNKIARLEIWLRQHKRPLGLYRSSINGYDLMSADDTINQFVYIYLKSKDRDASTKECHSSLGYATWIITRASVRFRGYKSLYLRQLSTMGAMLLRSLEMRERNALWEEQSHRHVQDAKELKERQQTPSPWGESICSGCGAKKRAWAEMTKWICARCGTPLGHFPAS